MNPMDAITTQRSAEIALELIEQGAAPPSLLADRVEHMGADERRVFLRRVQKHMEAWRTCPPKH